MQPEQQQKKKTRRWHLNSISLGRLAGSKLKMLAGTGQEELMLYMSGQGRQRAVMGLS